MAKQKELNEKLVGDLKKWQRVEDKSVKSTTDILNKTENPVVKIIMEIIRQDSAMHKRVQGLIIDNFEKKSISLRPEELGDIWDMVENHIKLEKKTIALAEEARKYRRSPIVRYLIDYLLADERKHEDLLVQLADIKGGMYPYA